MSEAATQHAAAARCAYYRDTCGLFAEVALGNSDRIVLPIGVDVGAFVMSKDTGSRVLTSLRAARRPVPVIEHPRSGRWTFLCGLVHLRSDAMEELDRLGVTVVEDGHMVVLPSPFDEFSAFRLWVQHPGEYRPLPPMSLVLGSIRAAKRLDVHNSMAGQG